MEIINNKTIFGILFLMSGSASAFDYYVESGARTVFDTHKRGVTACDRHHALEQGKRQCKDKFNVPPNSDVSVLLLEFSSKRGEHGGFLGFGGARWCTYDARIACEFIDYPEWVGKRKQAGPEPEVDLKKGPFFAENMGQRAKNRSKRYLGMSDVGKPFLAPHCKLWEKLYFQPVSDGCFAIKSFNGRYLAHKKVIRGVTFGPVDEVGTSGSPDGNWFVTRDDFTGQYWFKHGQCGKFLSVDNDQLRFSSGYRNQAMGEQLFKIKK